MEAHGEIIIDNNDDITHEHHESYSSGAKNKTQPLVAAAKAAVVSSAAPSSSNPIHIDNISGNKASNSNDESSSATGTTRLATFFPLTSSSSFSGSSFSTAATVIPVRPPPPPRPPRTDSLLLPPTQHHHYHYQHLYLGTAHPTTRYTSVMATSKPASNTAPFPSAFSSSSVLPPSPPSSTSSSSAALTNISPCCKNHTVQSTFQTLLLGQLMSVCLCGTAVASQLLANQAKFNAPATQSFLTYFFLAFVYGLLMLFRDADNSGSGVAMGNASSDADDCSSERESVTTVEKKSFVGVLRKRGWKYALLALVDVEANFFIVYAYQFTNLTSIQLLDCFTIPVVMLLSWFFLSVRYLSTHIAGVAVCLVGIATLIYSDGSSTTTTSTSSGGGAKIGGETTASASGGSNQANSIHNVFLGDGLCLVAATLYGIANVCEEYLVKRNDRTEYLGFIGIFGSIIAGTQLLLLEHRQLAEYRWSAEALLYYLLFTVCMFAFYSLVSAVMRRSSALMFNLQVLTSDFYSLLAGVFLFKLRFQPLYIVSFTLVLAGTIVYSVRRTREKSRREASWLKWAVGCFCPWVPICCGENWMPEPQPRDYTVQTASEEGGLSHFTPPTPVELRSDASGTRCHSDSSSN